MTPPVTILDAFRDAVDGAGDSDLVRYFDTPLAVATADELSDALAVGLAGIGVARGDRVAIQLQNVPQYALALLATWKLGAIAVACSPMLQSVELRRQLDDSGAETLVVLESLYEAGLVHTVVTTSELDFLDQPRPAVLAGSERLRHESTHDLLELIATHAGERPPAAPLGPDDVAVLTYTSGTTGPSKGAMNTHGNVLHSASVYRDSARLGRGDAILGIAPLFHVTGLIAHLATAMLVPVPLVLAYRFDPDEACRLIERHRATFTVAAITAFTAMLNAPAGAACDLGSLAKAYSGGAPVSPASAAAWEARTGHPLLGAYGLTETTSPTHLVPRGERAPVDPRSGALSVGKPVTGTTVRIVDPNGAEVGPGETGEIAVRGPQVVRGYWKNPEATAHALPDGEMRTGDVGLVDDEGWLFVVDRLKDLINTSGFKVWPRDVEDVLYEHPAVREAAVVGVPDDYRGEMVKAFVSLKPDESVEPGALVAFARERLAAYKYPREVEVLAELPKTASGKILRRSLRAR